MRVRVSYAGGCDADSCSDISCAEKPRMNGVVAVGHLLISQSPHGMHLLNAGSDNLLITPALIQGTIRECVSEGIRHYALHHLNLKTVMMALLIHIITAACCNDLPIILLRPCPSLGQTWCHHHQSPCNAQCSMPPASCCLLMPIYCIVLHT